MNIIFFGSSHFSVPTLKALLGAQYEISCVVTQPDKKRGRGLRITGTPIKEFATASGLPIYDPEKINIEESIQFLTRLNPDLFVVIAYGQILSQELLDVPSIMSLNLHASLLPSYRGAAPIRWAIIKGEKETGVTAIKMTVALDSGPVIMQKKIAINYEDTYVTLENTLSSIAAQVSVEVIEAIKNNTYTLIPQDKNKIFFAPKLKKDDGLIHWNKSAFEIYNQIRGCWGWPGAFTYLNDKLLKIFKAGERPFTPLPVRPHALARGAGFTAVCPLPGQIVDISKDGLYVATGKGIMVIEELQLEGKRKMTAQEFTAGHQIQYGDILGK